MSKDKTSALLWRVAPSVFLPALVFEIGNGAIAPVVALTALSVGAGPGTAGFMLALLGVGQVLGDVPSSYLADRVGDRRAMTIAVGIDMLALLGCFLSRSPLELGAALLAIGMSNATFYLARQSYLGDVVPVLMRARAMSTLGGSHRIGLFVGPFVGAAAISIGGLRAAFVAAMIAGAATAVLLLLVPDANLASDRPPGARGEAGALEMLRRHRRLFATLGIAVLSVAAVRGARQTVLPLWAEHLGLTAAATSLVFGIANAVDMALFYPAGKVMDRFGRLWIAIPAMLLMGGSMMLLPLAGNTATLTIIAMTMSLGNGIGSGIMMTLGADTAPADNRINFLSIWRVLADTGNAAGPVVVSVVATALTLGAGITAVGSVALIACAALRIYVPRFSPLATHAMVNRHREAEAGRLAAVDPSVPSPYASDRLAQ